MNVGSALSNTAKYFHLLIKASAPSPIDEEQSFKDFWALLMTRRIQHYRLDILGGNTPFRFCRTWYKRPSPTGMIRLRFCNNWLVCPRDWRPENYRGFLPADDDEYALTDFYIRCRLDGEVRLLIEVCGINHQWQSLFSDFNFRLQLQILFKLCFNPFWDLSYVTCLLVGTFILMPCFISFSNYSCMIFISCNISLYFFK